MKQKSLLSAFALLICINTFSQAFTSSNLPIVIINTDGGMPVLDQPRIFANMKIINRGEGKRNYLTDADSLAYLDYNGRIAIELRGSSSQVLNKKQYGFSTYHPGDTAEDNVKLLGFPKDNDWVLNGMGWDPLMIRDYVCYNLSRKIGEYASRTAYCELILNGTYTGLYLLQEKVKSGSERVNIANLSKSDFFMPNLTGGYIMKADRGVAVFILDSYMNGQSVPFVNVDPALEDIIPQQQNYIRNQFFDLVETTANRDYSVETGYPSVIDVRSFIDYMIITEFSSNADNYQISTYFHKDRSGKLRAGPIWDSDLTFGNDLFLWNLDRSWASVWQFKNGDNQGPKFWTDLFDSKPFRCAFIRRWNELIGPGGVLSADSVFSLIDNTAILITEATDRNNFLWGNGADMASGISDMKSWINNRISWMNVNMAVSGGCPALENPNLVISKIMYHPDSLPAFPNPKDYEFLEITNNSDKIINLSGYYFAGTGFTYVFPPYSVVGPHGTKILASNALAFKQKYGTNPSGEFTRSLSNGGEKLELASPFGDIVDYVKYSDTLPWPDADGNGAFLELNDLALDNNDPANWTATYNSVVSTPELPDEGGISIYPVPAGENVTVRSKEAQLRIELYNVTGVLVRTAAPNTTISSVPAGDLKPGIYYMKITTSGGTFVRKLVKE